MAAYVDKHFLGGLAGGVTGTVAAYPLDTLKVRLQSGCVAISHPSSISLLKTSYYTSDKFRTLFRGIGSPLLTLAPANALAFYIENQAMSYRVVFSDSGSKMVESFFLLGSFSVVSGHFGTFGGHFQSLLTFSCNFSKTTLYLQEETVRNHILAGAASGVFQTFLNSPTELIKIQMQINETRFKNSFSCGKYILAKHGMCGMRRGMLITLFREVPAFAGYFGMYDLMVNDVLGYQYTGVQSRNCDLRQKFA